MVKRNIVQILFVVFLTSSCFFACNTNKKSDTRILVFSKTDGYRHESISTGIEALKKLATENGFLLDTTENANKFYEGNLKRYSAVVFLNTTQNVLNDRQQAEFERYIQAGGGFMGIHAAADTEYNWPWYNKLLGAYFESHPEQQTASIQVVDKTHASTEHLQNQWKRFDEWYNYKELNGEVKVLMKLDEKSYKGGKNGDNHPIAWYHEYDGGRAFYTGLGHTKESYSEPEFLKHVLGGLKYVIGENKSLDYTKAHTVRIPDESRFRRVVLSEGLNEPMELAVAADGRVFFLERRGAFKMWDPKSSSVKLIKQMNVVHAEGNGLVGITLDPDFQKNSQLYLYFTAYNGKQLNHQVSRFNITAANELDTASEKVIIRIPIELESSAHTGGSLLFDEKGNLWISTGDNTVPFKSDGFAPIDERGDVTLDAQRSSGNTHDLRGKILRIHPKADGTYTVPDGNLFPKDGSKGRPEIYAMGCRNPYRMAYDSRTGFVYWGEVGPDSGKDSIQGPRGYDEINQARKPGFFGWPYFVGDNKAYKDKDFATNQIGEFFNAEKPVNNSPNNTGSKELPPAQKPLIWYPYAQSKEFPVVGQGGRTAIAGGVYHFDKNLQSSVKFPEYFDNKLFIMEWMRNWIKVVTLDKEGDFVKMEEFLPSMQIDRPMDMTFGSDGALYVLEYGEVYGIDNPDASLVKIEYIDGNRTPVIKLAASDTVGPAPLSVKFSAEQSMDYDEEDELTYEWKIDREKFTTNKVNFEHSFSKPGVYNVALTVTDKAGLKAQKQTTVKVGNSLPEIKIALEGNQTFFWEGDELKYAVDITDKEDGSIDTSKVNVHLTFVSKKKAADQAVLGHQQMAAAPLGKELIAQSDCKACHTLTTKSAGPAFMEVAKRYPATSQNIGMLADKIIKGGAGNWGPHPMAAHPQVPKADAMEMVKYVLSLGQAEKAQVRLPLKGELLPKDHIGKNEAGIYVLSASYTDKGANGVEALRNSVFKTLRNARLAATEFDESRQVEIYPGNKGSHVGSIGEGSFIMFKDVDLTGIDGLTYWFSSKDEKGKIELRLDSHNGELLSSVDFQPNGSWENWQKLPVSFKNPGGTRNLYFVFKKVEGGGANDLGSFKFIDFNKKDKIAKK